MSLFVTLDETGIGVRLTGGRPNQQFVQLASRTEGLQNITVLSSAGGSGVWLSDDVAQSIGAKAGDLVTLGQDPQAQDPHPSPGAPSAKVRVAGVYASLVGTVLPRFWCSETSIFGTPDDDFPPPPVILAPQSLMTTAEPDGKAG